MRQYFKSICNRQTLLSFLLRAGILLGLIFLAIYVRTYQIHPPSLFIKSLFQPQAEQMIFEGVKRQLKTGLDAQFPQVDEASKAKMAEDRTREVIATEKDKYQQMVDASLDSLIQARHPQQSRVYLLEADPYFYYYFTKQIRDTGRMGPPAPDRSFFNPYRRIPVGVRERMTWHPYLGYYWYQFAKVFKPQIELMEALCYFPLLQCVLIVIIFFVLARALHFNLLSATLGCCVLVFSPIVIQRNAFGWYDTDAYNFIFPMGILALFIAAAQNQERLIPRALAAGALTGCYSMFWVGWPLAFMLTLMGGMGAAVIQWVYTRKILNGYTKVSFWYAVFSLAFLAVILTPVTLTESFMDALLTIPKFAAAQIELWPTVFLTVGEASSTTLKKMIFMTGNYASAAFFVLGLVGYAVYAVAEKNTNALCRWVMFLAYAFFLFFMARQTERFTLIMVLPFAVFVAMSVEFLLWVHQKFFQKIPNMSKLISGTRVAVMIVAALFLILPTFVMAELVGFNDVAPIMNDTWYDALITLRDRTPKNAVVHSWWSPGHFISAIAERGVSIDGGAQHLLDTYWIAKALLANSEEQSAEIFRLVNAGGASAIYFLESLGFRPGEIISMIFKTISVPREKAVAVLPDSLALPDKKQLVALTHGIHDPPPTYVFLYNDLIEQNIAVSMIGQWNFAKAEQMKQEKQSGSRRNFLPSVFRTKQFYLQHVLSVIDGILKYTPESPLVQQEGQKLSFANGLTVDLDTKEAYVRLPGGQGAEGSPISLFYLDDVGQLIEKEYGTARMIDTSALLFTKDGEYYSLLADRLLIRSMLFRLYYLNGSGLRIFKPFFRQEDKATKTTICVYEIDWNVFRQMEESDGA